MPPRGSEGLDFTPILTHYLFLLTTIFSIIAWFISFISQAVVTSRGQRPLVNVLWFGIFLQLFLIAGVVYTLASDSISMHRLQISIFGGLAILISVWGVEQGIHTVNNGPAVAMSVGWLISAMIDILWVLYFTSEEDSLTLYIFNSLGTGGLTPPSRRRRTRQPSTHNMSANNGYPTNYSSGAGVGSHDIPYANKMGSGVGSQMGSGPARSQNSFVPSIEGGLRGGGGAGSINNVPMGGGPGSIGGPDNAGANSPLMAGVGAGAMNGGAPGDTPGGDNYSYKAKALYAYTASPDDPNEISFTKGEVLDILDRQGKWWQAKKADGTVGIAPSNYLQII